MNAKARHQQGATDPELLAAIAGGDLGGLATLFDRYEADAERLIARLGVNAADIDDLMQLTFLDVVRAAASFDGRSSARSWVLGLTVIVVRRHRRSLGRLARSLVAWAREPGREVPTTEERFEMCEGAERARQALGQLSVQKREVFVMVVLENSSGEETARALGIPVATVWTRLHYARRELRQRLSREMGS
jgi:RNA polymerase sigma factor (sigma-70 family)